MPIARKRLLTEEDYKAAIGRTVVDIDGAEGTIVYYNSSYYFLNNETCWAGSYPPAIRDCRYEYAWYIDIEDHAEYDYLALFLKECDILFIGEL